YSSLVPPVLLSADAHNSTAICLSHHFLSLSLPLYPAHMCQARIILKRSQGETHCLSVGCLPCDSPMVSWDRLQSPCDPKRISGVANN
uniref:Uncharacterized protein n=1 Tax=Seriola dumerili TaxID=41447 RepID=A0A3B4T3R4_SERDU